jgi:hypothetical protein
VTTGQSDRFRGHHGAYDGGDRAEHPGGRAVDGVAGREVFEDAAVAAALARGDGQDGADPADGGAMDARAILEGARVGHEKLRGVVIAPLDDDVGAGDPSADGLRGDALEVNLGTVAPAQGRDAVGEGVGLGATDVALVEAHESVEVSAFDAVIVEQNEGDGGLAREGEGGGVTDPSHADAQDDGPSGGRSAHGLTSGKKAPSEK